MGARRQQRVQTLTACNLITKENYSRSAVGRVKRHDHAPKSARSTLHHPGVRELFTRFDTGTVSARLLNVASRICFKGLFHHAGTKPQRIGSRLCAPSLPMMVSVVAGQML